MLKITDSMKKEKERKAKKKEKKNRALLKIYLF